MEKEFVSYEISLALKELGFDKPCFGFYNKNEELTSIEFDVYSGGNLFDLFKNHNNDVEINAPLYQQAFRWFENTYGLFVDRKTMCSVNEVMSMDYYIRSINGTWQVEFPADYSEFDPYKANTACLKKLIEIVKS